jgi:cardiolipin hydrolase
MHNDITQLLLESFSDNHLSVSIILAHQRKVNVRILTDNDKANDRGSDVYALKQQGIPVCMDSSPNHMHHKFALVDQSLVNGSFNWTRSASDYNQENIVISDHTGVVQSFDKAFEGLWSRFSQ